MPADRMEVVLRRQLAALDDRGTSKRVETVVRAVLPATGETGPRYLLAGHGDVAFLRMSSNGYLGLALHPAVIAAEEAAARAFGSGPGAVRFISGTFEPHVELERRLADVPRPRGGADLQLGLRRRGERAPVARHTGHGAWSATR